MSRIFVGKLLMISILIFCVLFSCDSDDQDPQQQAQKNIDPIVGVYEFNSAINKRGVEKDGITFLDAGVDFTAAFRTFLDNAIVNCTTAENYLIRFNDGGKLFFICKDDDSEFESGSWSFNESRSVLTLEFSLNGIPLNLVLENFSESGNLINGDVFDLPVPQEVLELLGLSLPNDQDFLATVNMSFIKVE